MRNSVYTLIAGTILLASPALAQKALVDDLLAAPPKPASSMSNDDANGPDLALKSVHPGLAKLKASKRLSKQGAGIMVWSFDPFDDPPVIDLRRKTWSSIILPEWEEIQFVNFGDDYAFEFKILGEESGRPVKNVLLIRPRKKVVEVDTTLHIFGKPLGHGRNTYTAYLHIQASDDATLSDVTIHVEASPPKPPSTLVKADAPATPPTPQASTKKETKQNKRPGSRWDGSLGVDDPDWVREIPFNLDAVRFDGYQIQAQTEDALGVAPVRVFDDGVFTMIDFGEGGRADRILRPIVFQVVDGANSPVNTRTTGPEGNILVVEGVGYDLMLQNGARVVCISYVGNYLKLAGQSHVSVSDNPAPAPKRRTQAPQTQTFFDGG